MNDSEVKQFFHIPLKATKQEMTIFTSLKMARFSEGYERTYTQFQSVKIASIIVLLSDMVRPN